MNEFPQMKLNYFSTRHTNTRFYCTINRPNTLNAINLDVMDELEQILNHVENSSVSLFELGTNETGYFASGGDLKEFSTLISVDDGHKMAKRMSALLNRIEALSCLTIASVFGKAFGGGFELALAFDLVYGNPKTLLGFTQAKFGLIPGWNGMYRLIKRVGYSKALHLLSSTALVKTKEAQDFGLIDAIFETEQEYESHIKHLLSLPLEFILSLKKSAKLYDTLLVEKAKEEELSLFAQTWGSENHHELVHRFLNKK